MLDPWFSFHWVGFTLVILNVLTSMMEGLGAVWSKGEDFAGGSRERGTLARPVAPAYRKCVSITCLFRAKSRAAGVTDTVQAAGGPALQPQSHGRAALPQHGGESQGTTRGGKE